MGDKVVFVHLPADQHRQLKRRCADSGVSMSVIIRKMIGQLLDETPNNYVELPDHRRLR